MSKIVIDIVLLPDNGIQKICREVNKAIWWKIDFTNTGKTPHISLLMGAVEESQLKELNQKLINISQKYSKISLTGKLKNYTIRDTGETLYAYDLEKNAEILKMFTEISTEIRPILEYENISTDMFYQPEEVEEQSIVWVKWFQNRTPEEYSGHITLGIWELDGESANMIHFEALKIAVYQLGNYGTCDNQLFEIDL